MRVWPGVAVMLARVVDVVMRNGQGCVGDGVRLGVVKEVEVRSSRDIFYSACNERFSFCFT